MFPLMYTLKVERDKFPLFCAKPGILALAEGSRGSIALGRPFRGTGGCVFFLLEGKREEGARGQIYVALRKFSPQPLHEGEIPFLN